MTLVLPPKPHARRIEVSRLHVRQSSVSVLLVAGVAVLGVDCSSLGEDLAVRVIGHGFGHRASRSDLLDRGAEMVRDGGEVK